MPFDKCPACGFREPVVSKMAVNRLSKYVDEKGEVCIIASTEPVITNAAGVKLTLVKDDSATSIKPAAVIKEPGLLPVPKIVETGAQRQLTNDEVKALQAQEAAAKQPSVTEPVKTVVTQASLAK